jgi:hypothetical protein
MVEAREEWFETVQIGDKRHRYVSKFLRKDFTVARELLDEQWKCWAREERLKFAGAFAARSELNDDDQQLLCFLLENGGPEVWSTVALSITKLRDRDHGLTFLLARVKEGIRPLANYYQALEVLATPACVPVLKEALLKHRQEVELHPSLKAWGDRFIYLDYLSCSATLLAVTGQEQYRANLEQMLNHRDEAIRKMVRVVAMTSNIKLSKQIGEP